VVSHSLNRTEVAQSAQYLTTDWTTSADVMSKKKAVPLHPTKAQEEEEVQLLLILDLGTR